MAALDALLDGLNPDQRSAVIHDDGPLQVIAGAGTGKTRVLVARVAWLIATGAARPEQICALAFMTTPPVRSCAASRRRSEALLPGACSRAPATGWRHGCCATTPPASAGPGRSRSGTSTTPTRRCATQSPRPG